MSVRTGGEAGRVFDLARQFRDEFTAAWIGAASSPQIDRLANDFAQVARNFRDLDFFGPGGTLELSRRVPAATCVRIEVPRTEFLHLTTVSIDADGVHDLRQETTVTTSSTYPGYKRAAIPRLLFDPQSMVTAFHTKRQPRPWLQITFHRPVDLTRIFLRNRPDAPAIRARGIQVLARTQGGYWITVYDGIERERALVAATEKYIIGSTAARRAGKRMGTMLNGRFGGAAKKLSTAGGVSSAVAAQAGKDPHIDAVHSVAALDLGRVLAALQLRDYATVREDLDRVELPPQDKNRFTELASRQIADRGLEWNIHGIKRTFRFWSEQEKQDYLGFVGDVIGCLRELNDSVCLGFGSALAAVRDRDLIPHDDMAEVLVGFEPGQASSLTAAKKLIDECLRGHGYTLSGKFLAHRHVKRLDVGPSLDVFAGIFEGDRISWYPGERGALSRDTMFPPQHRELLGRSFPVPREPEQYLRRIYGPDWETRDPHFRHRWRSVQYHDIR